MLERLLQEVAEGQGMTPMPELARRLQVSTELVEQMLAELVRLGYLLAAAPGCGESSCRGCSRAAACSARPQTRLWRLTEKGRQRAASSIGARGPRCLGNPRQGMKG